MPRRSLRIASKVKVEVNNNCIKPVLKAVEKEKNSSKTKIVHQKRKRIKIEAAAAHNLGSKELYIGCHTSISGGLWKAVEGAAAVGAKAFGLFLHSQQQWKMNSLVEGHAKRFRDACEKFGYAPQHIIPHGSYLMNCGSPREDVKEKSADMLIEELKRCEELGIIYFNFHPGSTLGKITVEECIGSIAEAINAAHQSTKYVITLLENMSCQGNTIGGKLEELRGIIDLIHDKSRVGVCIDTCHAHAAGYDLATQKGYDSLTDDLETIIGLQYVKAFHLNDSKGPCGSKKDRHENIGRGTIGIEGFKRLINDVRFQGTPMIIETPMDISDAEEIRLLYSLQINS